MGYGYSSQDKATAFNMGLATLERINALLISLTSFNVEGNITGMRNTILEVYKETYVFMDKPQETEAEDRWIEIEGYKINTLDSTSVKFSPDLILLINDFDFWLRKVLHKKGILMPHADTKGFSKLMKSYNIKK